MAGDAAVTPDAKPREGLVAEPETGQLLLLRRPGCRGTPVAAVDLVGQVLDA